MTAVTVVEGGDLFAARADALVNPVNCVGVMGKGLALAFKRRYPLMFADYQRDCRAGRLTVGRPALHRCLGCPPIISLPTKAHWRQPSTMEIVLAGVRGLAPLVAAYDLRSLAVPALGCGAGGLRWEAVRGPLTDELARLGIDIELHAPR